jgi:hypothetical protein
MVICTGPCSWSFQPGTDQFSETHSTDGTTMSSPEIQQSRRTVGTPGQGVAAEMELVTIEVAEMEAAATEIAKWSWK